jgi:hypothetical protein
VDFAVNDAEIRSFKNHAQMQTWKLHINQFRRDFFRLKFPPFFPLGHQQHIFAAKV